MKKRTRHRAKATSAAPAKPPPKSKRKVRVDRSASPPAPGSPPDLGLPPPDDTASPPASPPPGEDRPPAAPADQQASDPSNETVALPPRLRIPKEYREAGAAALRNLIEATPDAGADERILQELVARQMPIARMLLDIEAQLAIRMMFLDDAAHLVAVAKVFKGTNALSSAMSKRIQAVLSTAASLRAQRRFLTVSARAPEVHDDV